MSDDLLITPGSRKLEIKDSSGNIDAKIETDSSGNLLITNAGGDIAIGDTTSDIFVGDGTNNIDIVFEQDGEIRGTSGVTVTLGASGSNVRMATDLNLNSNDITNVGDLTVTNLTVSGTTTTVNSTNTTISDSIIELNSGLTGTNSKDIGFIFERGSTGNNAGFVWDESADRFTVFTTTDTASSDTVNTSSVANFQAGSFFGNGANLSSLNASNISSGTLANARLGSQVFLGGNSGTISGNNSQSFDTFTDTGVHYVSNWTNGTGTTNGPSHEGNAYGWGMLRVTQFIDSNYAVQEYIPHNDDGAFIRVRWNGTWGPWRQSWTSRSDGASSGLDADKLDGQQGSYYQNASNINAGTINTARLPNPIQLTGANAIIKLQETGVTNNPTWWHVADGGNYSIRLNNTGNYPISIETDSDNDAITQIGLNYTVDLNSNKLQFGTETTSYIQNVNKQSTDVWRFQTEDGYIDIGSENTSWAHFVTDRNSFYFTPKITVQGDINPYQDSSHNLGTSNARWANVYADTLYGDGSNITGITATDSTKLPLSGGTMSGHIAMGNYNITGVNQLEINDPGEGIVFKAGSSGDMVLKIIDDSSDNILQYAGTNAVFDVQGTITTDDITADFIDARAASSTTTNTTSYFSTSVGAAGAGDDWQNSPISVRERGLVGSAQSGGQYSPNINFHWASRVSMSLSMDLNGDFHLGDYNSNGVPNQSTASGLAHLNLRGVKIGNVTVINDSKNLTNIGTIGSTYITSSSTDVLVQRPIEVKHEGGGASTAGGIFLRPHYSGDTSLSSFSSAYSSGDLLIGSGMAYKSGASGIVSTFANFSDERTGIRVRRGEVTFVGTSAAVQTTVGDEITVVDTFTHNTTNGATTIKGDTNIGGTGNNALRVRHIEGKDSSSANYGGLFLNYSSTANVQIGHSGNLNDLYIYGSLRTGGVARINNSGNMTNIGTIASGNITSTGRITAGSGSGGVSLTHNDGEGNANVTFNHADGVPEQNGQSARITVNTDGTSTEAVMAFEVSSGDVTSGTALGLPVGAKLAHDYLEIPSKLRHSGDTDTYLQFDGNRIRLYAGGAVKIDTNNTYLTGITSSQVTTALGYTPISNAGGTFSGGVTVNGALSVNSGTANVVSTFQSTDGTAAIKLQDSAGNVELSVSGSTFQVQPSGSTAVYSINSSGNSITTGDSRSATVTVGTPDDHAHMRMTNNSGSHFGFDPEHSRHLVVTNEQGSTSQAMFLADTGATANDLWGVTMTTGGPTSGNTSGSETWTKKLTLHGNGDLYVTGDTNIGSSSDAARYIVIDKSTTGQNGIILRNAGNNKGKILLDSNEDLRFYVNNTTNAMTIFESGSVDFTGEVEMQSGNSVGKFAVASSAPHASYDFYNNGTSYFNGSVIIDDQLNLTGSSRAIKINGTTRINSDGNFISNANYYFGATDSSLLAKDGGNIKYMADGVHRFYTYNGSWVENTQIGDSGLNPLTNVYLTGGSDRRIKLGDSGTSGISTSDNAVYVRGNDDHLILNCAGNGYISFTDNGSEHMRIDTSGHVNIVSGRIKMGGTGILNKSSGTVKFGDLDDNDDITAIDISVLGGNQRIFLDDGNIFINGNANSNAGFKFDTQHFHSNGDVIAYSSTLTASDRRLKENIQVLDSSLEKVMHLQGVKYDWKEEGRGKNQLGLIAQEVEEIVPEVVNTIGDSLGKLDDMKVVNYSALVPVLIEAIKEQQEQIDKLTNIVEKLKEK